MVIGDVAMEVERVFDGVGKDKGWGMVWRGEYHGVGFGR